VTLWVQLDPSGFDDTESMQRTCVGTIEVRADNAVGLPIGIPVYLQLDAGEAEAGPTCAAADDGRTVPARSGITAIVLLCTALWLRRSRRSPRARPSTEGT